MKILIYGSNFSPELTGIGKYSGEMARWLSSRGHEVRVVTAPPHYPEWRVHTGYSASRYTSEELGGIRVFRSPVWVPKRMSGLKRIVHLLSFAFSSVPTLFRNIFWRPDIVFMTEPPLFIAPATLLFSFFSRAKSWLHIQDFEVDAAFELGLLRGDAPRRCVLAIESWLLQRFARVSTISQKMLMLARTKGVEPEKLVFFPNWVDLAGFDSPDLSSQYRDELGILREKFVVLYSGNMGGKQGLDILVDVARLLLANDVVQFVFCGSGSGRAELEQSCSGLSNVTFLDLQPADRFPDFLRMADVHLLPQRAGAADLVMPSKLTGMLASGRPVIATAELGTELADVVLECGVVVPPGDAVAFAAAIEDLIKRPDLRKNYSSAARSYAENKLDSRAVLSNLERAFFDLSS